MRKSYRGMHKVYDWVGLDHQIKRITICPLVWMPVNCPLSGY